MSNGSAPLLLIPLCVLVFGTTAAASYLVQTHLEEKTIRVVSKERLLNMKSDDKGSSTEYKNFVYSPEETYVVEDSIWNWHFRAGTVYAQIHPNEDCRVTLAGYRFGPFSMYQNIISAECGNSK